MNTEKKMRIRNRKEESEEVKRDVYGRVGGKTCVGVGVSRGGQIPSRRGRRFDMGVRE